MLPGRFQIDWVDRGREPTQASDPAFPNGRDINGLFVI